MLRPLHFLIGFLFIAACEDIFDLADKNDMFTGIKRLQESSIGSIDTIVFQYLPEYKYISVGLINDNTIVLTRSYGENRIGRTDVYASVSKPVTSIILAQLLEEGLFHSYDEPIRDYSEKYRDVMPSEYKDTPITFKHLLSHQAGIPHHERIWREGKLDLLFRPGTDVHYSTRGYGVLGEIMSEMTGYSYRKLVKHYIGDPVDGSSFSVPDLLFEAPGGLVISTIGDMAKFAEGLLAQTYVTDSLKYNHLWVPWAHEELGLGWYVHNYGTDSLSVYHAGSNGSPRAFIILRPLQNTGVVLLGHHNSADGDQRFYPLARALVMHLEKLNTH